jgi:uncharacterized membrane protein
MDQFPKLGRFLLALPMVVYAVLHFIYASFVATIVPPWIPWHLFWAYFAGAALFASGVAIAIKWHEHLAATLLGAMIFSWVLLIHVFLIFHRPGDAWAERAMFGDLAGKLNNAFKDLGLSGAAFLFAGMAGRNTVLALGRFLFGMSITAFGVLHFVYPAFAPGIPPMFTSVSFPIPGHLFWVYLTGAIFFAAGVSILIKRETRLTATVLGLAILVFALLIWVPRFGSNSGDIYGNWLKDIGLAGGALILAGRRTESSPQAEGAPHLNLTALKER